MARETKVGLLAGLAFIICVAVILANRGRRDFISTQTSPRINRPTTAPTREQAMRPVTRIDPAIDGTTSVVGGYRDADSAALVPQSVASHLDRDVPNSEFAAPPEETTGGVVMLGQRMEGLNEPRTIREPEKEARTPRPESLPAPPPVVPVVSRDRVVTKQVHYFVTSGDTLSNIAAAHYGSKSRTFINAIFDANRTLLSDPDVLQVGMRLVMPEMKKEGRPASHKLTKNGVTPTRRLATATPDPSLPERFRWYQIKPNDRYVKIASEQLSDESRWRDIYELNKDKFPNPQMIREGVRIKIPLPLESRSRGGLR